MMTAASPAFVPALFPYLAPKGVVMESSRDPTELKRRESRLNQQLQMWLFPVAVTCLSV